MNNHITHQNHKFTKCPLSGSQHKCLEGNGNDNATTDASMVAPKEGNGHCDSSEQTNLRKEIKDIYDLSMHDGITKDGHSMFFGDIVKELNALRRKALFQTELRIKDLEEEVEHNENLMQILDIDEFDDVGQFIAKKIELLTKKINDLKAQQQEVGEQ